MFAVATQTPSTFPTVPVDYMPRERFIRLPEVLYTTGLSRSTVYEMMTRKQFPAQVSLGGKTVAWLESEVESWMAERIANRHQVPQHDAVNLWSPALYPERQRRTVWGRSHPVATQTAGYCLTGAPQRKTRRYSSGESPG